MSSTGRVESGAQLLARLGPRPSIHGLGTAVFGFEPSPGDILELYGGEGVGKSELLLNLAASLIVSPVRKQHNALDNKAQVVWIDCDLKFSVFRLAVLLEHRVLNANTGHSSEENQNIDNYDNEHSTSKSSRDGLLGAAAMDGRSVNKLLQGEKANSGPGNAEADYTQIQVNTQAQNVPLKHSSENHAGSFTGQMQAANEAGDTRPGEESNCNRTDAIHSRHKTECPAQQDKTYSTGDRESVSTSSPDERSEEEAEKRVQESLENILVARVTSSQQLICTLCSLEASIAANSNIAILIIDPISAFFWTDRCRDDRPPSSQSFLHKTMSHVATILKRIAETYGILVAVTKQALVKGRPKETLTDNVLPSSKQAQAQSSGAENHVEFLDKLTNDAEAKDVLRFFSESNASRKNAKARQADVDKMEKEISKEMECLKDAL